MMFPLKRLHVERGCEGKGGCIEICMDAFLELNSNRGRGL